ncbi:hypothetical protein GIB67_013279, partial [Kingdonia uniflora]
MPSKTHGRGRGYRGMPLSKPRDPHALTIFDSGPKWRNHTQTQTSSIGAVNQTQFNPKQPEHPSHD